MFRTHPEAEQSLPAAFSKNGERSWHWIELPLCITYFLATFQIVDGRHRFAHTLMFSEIQSVLDAVDQANESYQLDRVDVLIPPCLHGETGYRLSQIKEVWETDVDSLFVLADGSTILDGQSAVEHAERENFTLTARF